MIIQNNISLYSFNTFHIRESAKQFVEISDTNSLFTLIEFAQQNERKIVVLGGGSNILLTKPVEDIVLLNKMKGIEIVEDNPDEVMVRFMSGEVWHDCVLWAVTRGFGGIENLSLIPGTIGAAPIQNIGAYGVELKDVFVKLEAIDLLNGSSSVFSHADCHFGYRDSIFKHAGGIHPFIFSVTLRLQKKPVFQIEYGILKDVLQNEFGNILTLKNISDAVIKIRNSKLPDPGQLGNAGSFFKNPVVDAETATIIKEDFPAMPHFEVENGIKIPAAWLIEQCGWKGFREKNYGVHVHQSLVLVNYADASGADLLDLAQRIITSVQQRFNITLNPEVNIW